TIDDLEAMPEDGNRYELIEGELFVSRAPSLDHQRIVRNLLIAFGNYLKQNPVGETFPGPGVIFSNFSSVIPDVVFISNERRKEIATETHITGAPDLIVEILSPGAENERRDRKAKLQLYRKYGVKEYWIVDPQKKTIDVYRSHKLRHSAKLTRRDHITTPMLPGFHYAVKDIVE
ncbi:MAG TPA: Uma2 family endonuclease, partial [Blastocatellia bacterium]